MKKFSFRLETPLKLKNQEEDRQKVVVATCQEEYQLHLFRLEELQEALIQLRAKLREAAGLKENQNHGKTLDINQLTLMQGYIPVLVNKLNYQQEQVGLALAKLSEARQRLMEIIKDRKILEKLKEKALLQYRWEVNREEQIILDELAAVGFQRDK